MFPDSVLHDYERNEKGDIREHVVVVPFIPEAIVYTGESGRPTPPGARRQPLSYRWHLAEWFCLDHGVRPDLVGRVQLPELDWTSNAPATMELYVRSLRPTPCKEQA